MKNAPFTGLEGLAEDAMSILRPVIDRFRSEQNKSGGYVLIVDRKGSVLFREAFGEEEGWKHDYRELAHLKIQQALRTGRSRVSPMSLRSGDTVWSGWYVGDEFAVAVSMYAPDFDVQVATLIWMLMEVIAFADLERYKAEHPGKDVIE